MTSSQVEEDVFFEVDTEFYQEQITRVTDYFLPQFSRMVKRYVVFNCSFMIFLFIQCVALIVCFTQLKQSYFMGFGLSFLFLSFFSYFISRSYLQAQRPEQLKELKERFIKSSKHLIHYRSGVPEHHLALANACCRFDALLRGKEYRFYQPPRFLKFLSPWLEKASCWCHWKDVHQMREKLLQTSVEEHIKLVKCEPVNLEVHASLANAYVMLSGIYLDPKSHEHHDEEKWVPHQLSSQKNQTKFRQIAEKAIEEFKILHKFAPDDPWVHAQLAYSYHDLNMPKEEIREYEAILTLCPGDKDTLYKLGTLYFQQGMNAKGLEVYEELKRSNYSKAESLIQSYC